MSMEDKKLTGRLFLMLSGIVFLIGLFYFWFFIATANINNFWGFLRGQNGKEATASSSFNALPSPPTLADVPEFINKKSFNIKGYSDPGLKATLYINEMKSGDTIVDSSGNFLFSDIKFPTGSITLYAKVKNSKEQESSPSKSYTVTFDETAPKLTIDKPKDGEKFTDPSPFYTAEGSVDEDATVYVNDHQAGLDADKKFSIVLNLKEGDNFFKFKAVDKAGNEVIIDRKLVYAKP